MDEELKGLLIAALAEAADIITTYWGLGSVPGAREGNPIFARIIGNTVAVLAANIAALAGLYLFLHAAKAKGMARRVIKFYLLYAVIRFAGAINNTLLVIRATTKTL